VHLLDGLLKTLDAAVEFGRDAYLFVKALREAAGAEAGFAD
jgi:hypothetical protein